MSSARLLVALVIRIACQVKDNAVEHFQVGLKLGFRMEDD